MSSDRPSRFSQIRTTISATRRHDPKFVPILIAAAVLGFAVPFALGLVLLPLWVGIVLGVLGAFTAATVAVGRRASKSVFSQIEGQPGAAYSVLMALRGQWHVTPAVGVTRTQEFVHRVVGRPGVILVAEGSPARARDLLGNEARRLRRVIGDTPLYDVVIGDGEGQVPLRRLNVHLMKLPRTLKPRAVNDLEAKLKAMATSAVPIPKGPLPKGARIPRGKIR